VAPLAVWIGWEQRVRHPLIDLRLLGRGHAHPVLAGQLRRQPVRRARRPAHLGRARGGGQLRDADRLAGAVPGRRDSYLGLVVVMAACGLGVGSVYAVNPLQITGGVPAAETGSAISFYQLVRTVAYAIASVLSATVLVLATPAGKPFPSDAGYSAAALVSIAVLVAALAVSIVFIMMGRKRS
jgi:hypothetical protein